MKVAVFGAGTMGSGIAQVCANAGYEVWMYDLKDEYAQGGKNKIAAGLDRQVGKGKMTEEQKEDLRKRRETECFSVINRGQLWYEGVSLVQLLELRSWYKSWLNVTETMVVPDKPSWLT